MKVLVTGAAGFIGSHLSEALLGAGHQIVGVDNFCDFYDSSLKRENARAVESRVASTEGASFELIEADIRDGERIAEIFAQHRPEVTVHLAAMAGVRPSIEQPAYYTAVNLDGTVNLLEAAVETGCTRFLFGSSSSVYGNNEKVPFAEDDRVDHPISPYAATKKAGELICHTYAHLHDLRIACLRFFTVFGPRQRPDLAINKFLRIVANGDTLPMFGDGSTSRDYTFVADIVDGIRRVIRWSDDDANPAYRVFNLGGSSPVRLDRLIATIEEVTGHAAKIEQLPMQPGDVNRTWADLERSREELGYEPRTSLAEGIEHQWRWMNDRS